MNIDGLIFDLDGTLWDASTSCAMAWNSALKKTNIENIEVTEEMVSGFSGKLLETIFAENFQFVSREKLNELAIVYEREEAVFMKMLGGDLYPGIKEQLPHLANTFRLFIVSNCMKGYIENFLHFHRLESFFTDYTCSGITGRPKAENISALITRNKLLRPVYIGDTKGDFEAAGQNKIPFIYARYGFGHVDDASWFIDDISELEQVIAKVSIPA